MAVEERLELSQSRALALFISHHHPLTLVDGVLRLSCDGQTHGASFTAEQTQ